MTKRGFSLYDIEEFLREAGAERINERAVLSFERELKDTVTSLVEQAAIYANYAGRRQVIRGSDVELAGSRGRGRYRPAIQKMKARNARQAQARPRLRRAVACVANGRVLIEAEPSAPVRQ